MTELDLDFVRGQFPAFKESGLKDHAFFENAGGSLTCRQVIWRLHRHYKERSVRPYSPYSASQAVGAEMDEARARLARLLGVDTDELTFGPSTSANTYVLAQAFRRMLDPGDAIIVTDLDHEASSAPWRRLAEDGLEIREWRVDPETGHLNIDTLAALLDKKVRLVCFPHASNILGEINPVAEIATLAHRAGAFVCVDGVSYAPHGLPNVEKLGADIYLFSTYVTYGPHQGVMAVRRALAQMLPNQGHPSAEHKLYSRLVPAGADAAQIAACAGIADYIDAIYAKHFKAGRDATGRAGVVHDLMRAQETLLVQPLLEFLLARSDVRVLGPHKAAARTPTLALELHRSGVEVAAELASHGVMASGGVFGSQRTLQAMGIDVEKGVLRLSLVHYTSAGDVARLMRALDTVL